MCDNVYEVITLGSGLMCNDACVCGERMNLKIIVRDISERRKYLESEYVMMFLVPLMCWEYRDISLMMRLHPRH